MHKKVFFKSVKFEKQVFGVKKSEKVSSEVSFFVKKLKIYFFKCILAPNEVIFFWLLPKDAQRKF